MTDRRKEYPQLLLDGQICFPMYAASRKMVNHYTPYLKPLGITYTQYLVLLALWECGHCTVGDLCRRLYLDNGTITPMLKKMEEEGFIARSRSKQDERVVAVTVTEKGWALREQVKDVPEQLDQCIRMAREDSYQLFILLHKLLDNLDKIE